MPQNQTTDVDPSGCSDYFYHTPIIPILYFLIFPVALLLNAVAAWISLHLKSTSTFIVYLKNLVAADIIVALLVAIKSTAEFPGVPRMLFVLSCYVGPIFYSTQYTCIAFLGMISLDRFFKIMTPHSKFFGQNLTLSKLISISVWVILFGTSALPNIILSNQSVSNVSEITSCMTLKGQTGLELHEKTVIYVNVLFWFISVVIVVCYISITTKVIQSFRNSGSNNSQGKQEVKLRVFLVVIVFFVSFGPYHIVRIPYTFVQVNPSTHTGCFHIIGKLAKELSLWFATTNICINPFLYIFLCREYKEKLMSIMEDVSVWFQKVSGGKAHGASAPD